MAKSSAARQAECAAAGGPWWAVGTADWPGGARGSNFKCGPLPANSNRTQLIDPSYVLVIGEESSLRRPSSQVAQTSSIPLMSLKIELRRTGPYASIVALSGRFTLGCANRDVEHVLNRLIAEKAKLVDLDL